MTIKEMNYAILKKYLFIIVIVIDSTKKILNIILINSLKKKEKVNLIKI